MINPDEDYAYSGENALNLFHLFVNELNSKISDGFLKVGNIPLQIENSSRIKYKIEYLWRSAEKRPSRDELKRILSNDHLRKEIYENGSRP